MSVMRTKSIEQSIREGDEPEYQLKRRLTALDLTVFGVGVIIGAGIFTLTGRAAKEVAGPSIVLSFVLAAICCGLAALCYAEFASTVPVSGSAYTFSYATLGELVAWIIGWDLLLELLLGAAVVAQGWSAYFGVLMGQLGAQVREEVRDVWLTRWLRDFVYDLRFSARSFLRSPSFTATAVLSLALGIGATTAIYSLVDQVILHALPVRQPERLVLIDWKGDQAANGFGSLNLMSYPICRDLQLQDRFFEGVLCRAATTVNLSTGGEHKPAAAEIVSGTYFSVLGVRPALGRLLTIDDDQTPGASPVVVLSYDFWKTQLAGAADVVGRKVLVNQTPDDGRRRCRSEVPGHRCWRSSITLDSGRDVGAGHSRLSTVCSTAVRAGCRCWAA